MRLAPVAVGILIAATVLRSGLDLLWNLAGYATVVIAGLGSTSPGVVADSSVWRPDRRRRVPAGGWPRDSAGVLDRPIECDAAGQPGRSEGTPRCVSGGRGSVLPIGTTLNKNGAAVSKAATAASSRTCTVCTWRRPARYDRVATIVASSAASGVSGSSCHHTHRSNAIGLGGMPQPGSRRLPDRAAARHARMPVNTFSNLVGTAVVARAEGERSLTTPTISEKDLLQKVAAAAWRSKTPPLRLPEPHGLLAVAIGRARWRRSHLGSSCRSVPPSLMKILVGPSNEPFVNMKPSIRRPVRITRRTCHQQTAGRSHPHERPRSI